MNNNIIPTKEEWINALINRQGKDRQECFLRATVAICGLGGLGSNIAISLARAGVGKLILIDFDRVDLANLHRQEYKASQIGMFKTEALTNNLKEISPYTSVTYHTERLDENNIPSLLKDADIICEAFDKADNKAMLVNTALSVFKDKIIVSGIGMAGFESANMIKTRKVMDRLYVSGDMVSDVENGIGLICSRVKACAAHEAHMILRLLLNEEEC